MDSRVRTFTIVLLMTCSSVVFADTIVDVSTMADKCGHAFGYGACTAFAGKNGVTAYAEENISSRVLRHAQFGEPLAMLEPASKLTQSRAQWVPIVMGVQDPEGRYSGEVRAHVLRAQVVLHDDFRRVVGCWPLRRVVIPYSNKEKESMEHYSEEVFFNAKGIACSSADPNVCASELPGYQNTYYAEGIFLVPHKESILWGYIGSATLNYSARTALYQGATLTPFKEVEWLSSEELKSCTKIPVTDDVQPPIIKD